MPKAPSKPRPGRGTDGISPREPAAGRPPTARGLPNATTLALAIVILFTAALRVPMLGIPFERDEGEYAYIAWRLGQHELPYRDWVDQKPPAIFWAYRLAGLLPLDPIRSVHLVGFLFSAGTAVSLLFLARRWMPLPWATVAALVFAALSADPRAHGQAANTELFMLLPLILSLLAFLAATNKAQTGFALAVLCGALTGIAVAFKQVAAINWLFLLAVHPIFVARRQRLRQTLLFGVYSLCGAACIWGAIVAYFALHHALRDMVANVFTHNLEYIHALSWSARATNALKTLAGLSQTQAFIWVFAAAALPTLWCRGQRQTLAFLAAWLLTSLIGVSASGYFFPHYFQQLLPPLAVAAAFGAQSLEGAAFWKAVPSSASRPVTGVLLALLPALALLPFLFRYSPAEAVRKIYPRDAFALMPELASRVGALTQPQDRLFVFGAEPELLFYARRVSATRYIFLFPLYGPYRDVHETQVAAAKEIEAAQPAAALYLPNRLFFRPGTDQYLTEWTQSYLRAHFRPDTSLTVDASGNPQVITSSDHQPPASPPGHRVVGILWAKTSSSPGPP
jgi:4-amino-4-deoxy-L-arabinose transferase-like glycosyltransferase